VLVFAFADRREEGMKFSTRKVEAVAVIDIEGKILLGEGDVEIKQEVNNLIKRGNRHIILNLTKVPYMDSAGLGEIIRCFTAVRKDGGNLKLVGPNERLIDLLTITKLINVLDWFDDEAEAIRSFAL
jgi:anti-sigma B factor antagonist